MGRVIQGISEGILISLGPKILEWKRFGFRIVCKVRVNRVIEYFGTVTFIVDVCQAYAHSTSHFRHANDNELIN